MRESAIAKLTATVVLPTPPFPLATTIRFFTPSMGIRSCGAAGPGGIGQFLHTTAYGRREQFILNENAAGVTLHYAIAGNRLESAAAGHFARVAPGAVQLICSPDFTGSSPGAVGLLLLYTGDFCAPRGMRCAKSLLQG
jgi:hypothetical protein